MCKVDKENVTVVVEIEARVSQVIDALRDHGFLTQPDLASTTEQQIWGCTKIEVDATGCKIAPIDAFVAIFNLVTPTSRGTVEYLQKLDLDVLMWSASDYKSCSCARLCMITSFGSDLL